MLSLPFPCSALYYRVVFPLPEVDFPGSFATGFLLGLTIGIYCGTEEGNGYSFHLSGLQTVAPSSWWYPLLTVGLGLWTPIVPLASGFLPLFVSGLLHDFHLAFQLIQYHHY